MIPGTDFTETVRLGLAHPIPPWGWALVLAGAAAAGWWGYRRLEGARPARWTLGTLRAVLLVALALLLAGPEMVTERRRVERDWVVVLADRSASLRVTDAPGAPGRSREDQLRDAMAIAWPAWEQAARQRQVQWLGFGGSAFELTTLAGDDGVIGVAWGEPDRLRTDLPASLEQALERVAGRPLAGVVVLSDGRSARPVSDATLRALGTAGVPVYAVPLGGEGALADLALTRVEGPASAFVDDMVRVSAVVERRGRDGESARATVRLVDAATGLVLDSREVEIGAEADVSLAARSTTPGAREWRVELVTTEPDPAPANNSAALTIDLIDRPIRVAYFDGSPRWEQRFLKYHLRREPKIDIAAMLLATNRRYVQDGDIALPAVPRSPEEWAAFDVVILGDLRAQLLSADQLEQVRQHVAERGAGLLWLAGPGGVPGSFAGTALADLLPFRLSEGEPISVWDAPVTMRRAPASDALGVLDLAGGTGDPWPGAVADAATGWSTLRWAQRIDSSALKPTAQVLATLGAGDGRDPTPAVLTMRYGAGRIAYVATDEIWRWRYGRGEALPERFWVPLVRLLARDSLARGGADALLRVEPRRPLVDQPVRVSITVLDQSIADTSGQTMRVELRPQAPPGADAFAAGGETLLLGRETESSAQGSVVTFAVIWTPDEPGVYDLAATDPALAAAGLRERVEVLAPDDELREPAADHAALTALAEATGGAVVHPDQLGDVPGMLPNRERVIEAEPRADPLWDRGWVLALLVGLAALEWIGRRLIRLV